MAETLQGLLVEEGGGWRGGGAEIGRQWDLDREEERGGLVRGAALERRGVEASWGTYSKLPKPLAIFMSREALVHLLDGHLWRAHGGVRGGQVVGAQEGEMKSE